MEVARGKETQLRREQCLPCGAMLAARCRAVGSCWCCFGGAVQACRVVAGTCRFRHSAACSAPQQLVASLVVVPRRVTL